MTNCFAKIIDCGVTSLWTSDVNANCHSIFNLKAINCIPVKNFMQNPAQSDLDMNGYKIFNTSKIILGATQDNGSGAPVQITVPPNTPPITVNGVPIELPKDIQAGPNITVQDSQTVPATITISAIPSGNNGNIQFNGSGFFAGSDQLNWFVGANTFDVNGNINLRSNVGDTYYYSINGIPFARLAANRVQIEFLNASNLVNSISPGNLTGAITLLAGANVSISQSGQTITIASTGGGAGSSQWIDITGGGIYYSGGFVGMGNANPQFQLDVTGDANITGLYRINGIPLAAFQVTNAVDTTQSYANPSWITSLDWSKITNTPVGGIGPAGSNTQVQYNNSGAFGASPYFTWDNLNAVLTLSSPYVTQNLILNSSAAPDAGTSQNIVFQKPNFNAQPICYIQTNCGDNGSISLDFILQPDGGGQAGEVVRFRRQTTAAPWTVFIGGNTNISSGTGTAWLPDANTLNSHLVVGDDRIGSTYGEITVYGNTTVGGLTFGSINFANYSRLPATEARMAVISGILTSGGNTYGGMRFQTMYNQTLDPIGIYMTPGSAGTNLAIGTSSPPQAFSIVRSIGSAGISLQTDGSNNSTVRGFSFGGGVSGPGLIVSGMFSRGTMASPTSVLAGDILLQLEGWGGITGAGGSRSSMIQMIAESDWSGGSIPSAMIFSTTSVTAMLEWMRITSVGYVGIGTSNPQFPLDVVSSQNYIIRAMNTSNWAGIVIDHAIATGGESVISFRSVGNEAAVIEYDSDEDRLTIFTGNRDAVNATLTCDTNSRVGIMTTTPAFTLDVAGSIHARDTITSGAVPTSNVFLFSGYTTTPFGVIQVVSDGWSESSVRMYSYSASAQNYGSNFIGYSARGSQAAPAASVAGDALAKFWANGYSGTQWLRGAEINVLAEGNWDNAVGCPAYISFRTIPANNLINFERMRITSAGYVGIGTSTPSDGLTVSNGGIRVTSTATNPAANNLTIDYETSPFFRGRFISYGPNTITGGGFTFLSMTSNNTLTSQPITILANGNVGIGMTVPIVELDMPNYFPNNSAMRIGSMEFGAYGLNNSVWSDNIYYGAGGWTYRNTGSGAFLQIQNGSFFFSAAPSGNAGTAATPKNTFIIQSNGTTTAYGPVVSYFASMSGTSTADYANFGSNGWMDPVTAAWHIPDATKRSAIWQFTDGNAYLYNTQTPGGVDWAARLVIVQSGNVGIGGINPPSYQLQVQADSAAKPGTNTWTIASDIRTKQNVQRFNGDIEVIRRLNPTVSEYNGKAQTPKGLRVVSFDPDELKEVVPQCVSYVKGKLDPDDEEETDIAGINTHEIFFHMLRAVQQIDARLQKLEKK